MQCKTELVGQVGLFAVLGIVAVCPSHSVQAQITPDTTLGAEASQVLPNVAVPGGQGTWIEGGTTRGAHLFHSFSDFNVGSGQRVYFDNPAGVLNIFSRVTGNSGSNILGTLGVDGMANLYLLNPNGIVFGPNARLDISGSFVASTANRLMFDNGQFFSAVNPNQPPLLQINVTPGLQYGNNLNATIRNQGNLQVGQNLTLGAQRLELAGSLEAGRDITLQGWSRQLSNADYMVGGYLFTQDLTGQGIDLLIPHENVILANGDVQFIGDYIGESLHILAGGQVSGAAGTSNITITGTSGGSVTQQIATGTGGFQNVTVTAIDQPIVDIRSGEGIVLSDITNNGGDIALWAVGDIIANNLDTSVSIVSDSGEDVQGADGGTIFLAAGQNIFLGSIDSGSDSGIDSGSGSGSDSILFLSSGDVMGGNGGAISLVAGRDIYLDSINSRSLSGTISDSILFSSSGGVTGGNGGAISLVAGRDISLNSIDSSSSSISFSRSDLFSSSGGVTGGNGGAISLVAGRDISLNSIDSSSNSFSLSFSLSDSSGDVSGGDGGAISLVAGRDISLVSIGSSSTSLSFSALASDSFSVLSSFSGDVSGGDGGAISLVADRDISLVSIGSNSISFSSSGDVTGGDGGAISLATGRDLSLVSIDSYSSSPSELGDVTGGDGGRVSLIAGQNISLDSIDSYSVSASGNVRGGNGGAISLKAKTGSILNIGELSNPSFQSFSVAKGGSSGSGGTVTLEAATQIGTGNSDYRLEILTLSSSGQSGAVQIVGLDENFDILNLSVIASKRVEVLVPLVEPITIPVGEAGQSGDVDVFGRGNITFTNSSFLSDTNGTDPAGNVTIRTPGSVTFNNSLINTNTQSSGPAGGIDIRAASITLDPSSKITAFTRSSGQAGSIQLRPYGNGQTLNINLIGENSLISSSSLLPDDADTTFNGTEVTGNSGSIFISAPAAITIQGEGDLKVETETSGNAGRLEINAPRIVVDGVEVSASSELPDLLTDELSEDAISQVRANYQSGQGGSIEINTRELILRDRAEITADTSTLGRGGNLVVQNIGNPLTIRGDGQLTVSASGANSGRAGTLEINASGLLSLLDGIELTASSESINGGGEIDITVDGSLFMAGDSLINASASNPNVGDGGNITINLIDGLLIAPPGQNNDIIANAAGGNGGKIAITALGIYGFTLQDISDVEVLRSNSTNDISASSNTGVDGEITLNTFELDLSQLSELPANLVDVSGLAEQSLCQAGRGSEFIVTGRGGLPNSPNDALSNTATWEDWSIDSSGSEITSTPNDEALGTGVVPVSSPAPSTVQPIIEAQGWTRTANGQIALVTDPATVNPNGDQLIAQGCRQLRQAVSSDQTSS